MESVIGLALRCESHAFSRMPPFCKAIWPLRCSGTPRSGALTQSLTILVILPHNTRGPQLATVLGSRALWLVVPSRCYNSPTARRSCLLLPDTKHRPAHLFIHRNFFFLSSFFSLSSSPPKFPNITNINIIQPSGHRQDALNTPFSQLL